MKTALAAFSVLAALLVAGCGGDSSGETTAAQISISSPTAPVAPATVTGATAAQPGKTPTKASTVVTGPGGCEIPDTYMDFKFTGIDCPSAVTVAVAWDKMGSSCNTIDNPNSPLGFNRTCSVNGYRCTAKRDTHSDGRFVSCTQGGKSIRFTWVPV